MRVLIVFLSIFLAACSSETNTPPRNANAVRSTPLPVAGYEVVNKYPHDPKAFTQGLIFHNGFLYESTGQEGRSSVRKVEIETGKVVQKFDLPKESFAEGMALLDGKLYQLTYTE